MKSHLLIVLFSSSRSFFPSKCCGEREKTGEKTEEKNKLKDLPGKTRGKRCVLLSTPTRSKTRQNKERERTYPRVLATFFPREKTFRVAFDTLNEMFSFLRTPNKRETCAASFSSCTVQTDPVKASFFVLRITRNEEREARILTLCVACLCKKSARFGRQKHRPGDDDDDDDAGGRCATLRERRRI